MKTSNRALIRRLLLLAEDLRRSAKDKLCREILLKLCYRRLDCRRHPLSKSSLAVVADVKEG
jgi:hypothetical protein